LQYLKSQHSGLNAERAVMYKLTSEGWDLVLQRARTSIGEIDLIFEKKDRLLLIEVKKLNSSWRAFERIDLKQTQKLQRNLILFSQAFKDFKVFASLCWVDEKNKTYFVELS
jgi:Holliday junction resolvase-like predicted endonuclease